MRRIPVLLGGVRRFAVLPGRRRRFLHRSAVVVRREKGAGIGVAGGSRRPYLVARLRTPDGRARILRELGAGCLCHPPSPLARFCPGGAGGTSERVLGGARRRRTPCAVRR